MAGINKEFSTEIPCETTERYSLHCIHLLSYWHVCRHLLAGLNLVFMLNCSAAVSMLRNSFAGVMSDELFLVPTKEAKDCLQAAQGMLQQFSSTTEIHQQFSDWLVTVLNNIVESGTSSTGLKREKLWINYHRKVSSPDFVAKWKEFACEIGVQVTSLFLQHITDDLFNVMLNEKFGVSQCTYDDELPDLTYEEQNAVHYVGGYVLHALKKSKGNADLLPIVDKLIMSDGEHTGTSQTWLKSVDRGGLTDITDEAYQCFYAIEIAIRRHLRIEKTREMNKGFVDKVTTALLKDEDLLFNWCLAVGLALGSNYDDDMADRCLKQIVKKWITIRGFSFSNSLMEMYKQQSKTGTEKSKPLRSKLFPNIESV